MAAGAARDQQLEEKENGYSADGALLLIEIPAGARSRSLEEPLSQCVFVGRDHLIGGRDKRVSRSQCQVTESGGRLVIVRLGPNRSFYQDEAG